MKICPTCGEVYADHVEACPRDRAALHAIRDPYLGKMVGGRYRLISRLGSGGMSAVYLARHLVIDRLVAVKALRRDLARDPVQRDRFIREARAVNRINHQNIVEITDFGETEEGLVYLVMEYVPGESLLSALGSAPFRPERALAIAEQAGSALGRAHQMGVVHRDLKPENMLLVPTKKRRDFVKILDFGIAKILDAPSLTGSQQIFGTPGYIAPEYIQSAAIDGRADLYSLGVILYEMLTGALPFDYEYPGDLLVKHVTDAPIPPRERHDQIEEPLEALILRCLEKDPSDRFRDAYHFLEELHATRERLGGALSWGGLNEEECASDAPTPALEAGTRAERLTQTIVDMEPPEALRAGLGERDVELEDDRASRAARPTVRESREEILLRMRIPSAPVVVPAAAEIAALENRAKSQPPRSAPAAHLGTLGARRWRSRFAVLQEAVGELPEPPPAAIDGALRSAEGRLHDLESGVAEVEAWQREIEALSDQAREVRGTLGSAIDRLAQSHSRVQGEVAMISERHESLCSRYVHASRDVPPRSPEAGAADALLWERVAVEEQLRDKKRECAELEDRLRALRRQLDRESEELEDRRAQVVAQAESEVARLDALSEPLREALAKVEDFVRRAWD